MSWAPIGSPSPDWTADSAPTPDWAPVTVPGGSWATEAAPVHVFDPHVFDRAPIFDTGSLQGVWDTKTPPVFVWTQE